MKHHSPWGLPAQGVKLEFKRAYEEIKKDADKFYVWKPILQQYKPTFLGMCENAVELSNGFVRKQLETVMFKGEADAKKKASRIVKKLTNVSQTKTHDRHYHADDCAKMGLKIQKLEASGEQDFQDLVLTIHHCYMHLLMNTNAFKIIENQVGAAFIKNQPIGPAA